jgi:FKBP-type peptidyl-prolyl cis-trans isomerase FkpA
MKKGILLAVYVVVAAVIIGVGVWYGNKITGSQTITTNNNVPSSQTTTPGQTQTTMDGLMIKDQTVGTGAVAGVGDLVTVNYTGTLDNGTVFDSSLNPGRTPFNFILGAGQVIKGWDEGVLGMAVGGTRDLTIPPALAYGSGGAGTTIPPNATLHFVVTLLAVSTSSAGAQ